MQRRMDARTMNAAILLIMKTASPVNSPGNQRNARGINAARLISRRKGKKIDLEFIWNLNRREPNCSRSDFNFARNRTFFLSIGDKRYILLKYLSMLTNSIYKHYCYYCCCKSIRVKMRKYHAIINERISDGIKPLLMMMYDHDVFLS